ncbi:ATP--cob(I)alamin adenosyltransferase [Halolactibacillus alkaliphilus]|uniref:Corrinoid adenosyltransferase n=1 Tax=Halolactibacillus alkaliphilus TaxID=442899 RepID=A0A511X4V6_9BACI|nr:cob(I)yrinic acid a,c-diamide adenosyltransferase [Halolactibacillus alkaliphilus]GEN57982.1 ATP--cob(I)alamin adenosyltransferase [Halolactibacillus alkaliphilus]GGN75973.1 ATP--cob(I)alamin adenosyltransferase [Halolactibacillus alkaliphilus]SFP10014.1 cob(I)alamin adenosyltransferase [Halolactibacillus alkaliphilus]
MRIYTRSGDFGETSLVSGERVKKNHLRVEAYGTVDEANAVIGYAISTVDQGLTWSLSDRKLVLNAMDDIQAMLFYVGSELSTPTGKEVPWPITQSAVDRLEQRIDIFDDKVPPLKQFILPSGHPTAASFHHARTIVRRAERLAVALKDEINPLVIVYLNRLSDLLFVAARFVNTFSAFEEKVFVYKEDQ